MTTKRTFELTPTQVILIRRWLKSHQCSERDAQRLLYTFSPTGIGDVVVVTCHCGEEFNATDYDDW